MFSIKVDSIIRPEGWDYVLQPACRLLRSLGLNWSEEDIVRCIVGTETRYCSPMENSVCELIRLLYCAFTADAEGTFHMDAESLKNQALRLDYNRLDSFFYERALKAECQYLLPFSLTLDSELRQVLCPLRQWKQHECRHHDPIGLALMCGIMYRCSIAHKLVRYNLDWLTRTLLESLPENLESDMYGTLSFITDNREVLHD